MIPRPIFIQIIKTICVSTSVFLFSFCYMGLLSNELSLYVANKAIGNTAIFLLALVVASGPMSRIYAQFGTVTVYRKWLGILSFIVSILHGGITLFLLPDYFPSSRFTLKNIAFDFALLTVCILVILFVLSFDRIMLRMNRLLWWKIQNWGVRCAFVTAFFHTLLVKYPSWLTWGKDSPNNFFMFFPPLSLLIFEFLLFIACIRVWEFFGRDRAKKGIARTCFAFVFMVWGTFLWHVFF